MVELILFNSANGITFAHATHTRNVRYGSPTPMKNTILPVFVCWRGTCFLFQCH